MLGGVGLQAAHDPLGSRVDRDTLHPQRELLYRLEQCQVMALRVLRPLVLADQRGPVLQRRDLPLHPSGDEVQTRQPSILQLLKPRHQPAHHGQVGVARQLLKIARPAR